MPARLDLHLYGNQYFQNLQGRNAYIHIVYTVNCVLHTQHRIEIVNFLISLYDFFFYKKIERYVKVGRDRNFYVFHCYDCFFFIYMQFFYIYN